MKKIEIFDPAMCCSTGVCGPSIDPELIRMSLSIHNLQQNGVDIQRFNLATEPAKFVENKEVNGLIQSKGTEILPVTLVNGVVFKEGTYPTNEELAEITETSIDMLGKEKVVKFTLDTKKE